MNNIGYNEDRGVFSMPLIRREYEEDEGVKDTVDPFESAPFEEKSGDEGESF